MASEPVELSPHVTRWMGPNGGGYPYGNPLTVTGGQTTVLLDSALGYTGPRGDQLLLSHYHEDHVVDASARADSVAIHELDAPALREWDGFVRYGPLPRGDWEPWLRSEFAWGAVPEVRTFDDGAVFDVGGGVTVTAVPLPGHTGGHCGFFVEPDRVFYLADIELSSFGPVYSDRGSDLQATRDSLAACAQVDAAVVVPYHSKGPFLERSEYLSALRRYRDVIDVREERLLALLGGEGAAVEELLGRGVMYRPATMPWFGRHVERVTCERHLAELVGRGTVIGPDGAGRYRLAVAAEPVAMRCGGG